MSFPILELTAMSCPLLHCTALHVLAGLRSSPQLAVALLAASHKEVNLAWLATSQVTALCLHSGLVNLARLAIFCTRTSKLGPTGYFSGNCTMLVLLYLAWTCYFSSPSLGFITFALAGCFHCNNTVFALGLVNLTSAGFFFGDWTVHSLGLNMGWLFLILMSTHFEFKRFLVGN